MNTITRLLLCLGLAASAGCANFSFGHRDPSCDPDARLAALLDRWEEGQRTHGWRLSFDCERLQYEVERLSLEFPGHTPTLMACAALGYEVGQPEKAQTFIDRLFAIQPAYPEAGILRSRVALDDGNLPLARQVLATQIQYSPDHPGLREALSGCLYLQGDLAGAQAALTAAENLGAPAWRLAYHRGLLAEAGGDVDEAKRQYEAASQAHPEYLRAKSRLTGMNAAGR